MKPLSPSISKWHLYSIKILYLKLNFSLKCTYFAKTPQRRQMRHSRVWKWNCFGLYSCPRASLWQHFTKPERENNPTHDKHGLNSLHLMILWVKCHSPPRSNDSCQFLAWWERWSASVETVNTTPTYHVTVGFIKSGLCFLAAVS